METNLDFNQLIRFKEMERELNFTCEMREQGYALTKDGIWDIPKEGE